MRRFREWNTLRNQMLVGFLGVMIIILCVVGVFTFDSVSRLLKNNAEKHIQQTAVEANGRLEAVLNQIDSLTTQVATNAYVQKVLLNEQSGKRATFAERQALLSSIKIVQTYADGITSVELYSGDNRRLFPLDEGRLDKKVGQEWIARAKEGKGRMVWIGKDPLEPNTVLAIRSVSLMDHWFTHGGYVLVRMDREAFRLSESLSGDGGRETMLVVGPNYSLIASSAPIFNAGAIRPLVEAEETVVSIGKEKYMLVKQSSEVTGWIFLILTPVSAITEGISVLRTAILMSAGLGTLLFIVLSFPMSTIITRPVFKLIKTMRGARLGGLKPTTRISSTIEINELNHTYNQMVEHMNELIELVYEKELIQSRTELKALQAQIHPHFLFNTLEALYWSLQEKQEEELAEYVIAMADLFRYTITGPNKEEWVTLGDELEHIERYLLIMKMRLGDRIAWSVSTSPAYAAVRMPKLLIQPLVENAILHGIEGRIGPGTVTIRVEPAGDGIHLGISVEDDGRGMDEETLRSVNRALESGQSPPSKGTGMGIFNVRQRLKIYYGRGGGRAGGETERPGRLEPGLSVSSGSGEGTRVTITIPLRTGEE